MNSKFSIPSVVLVLLMTSAVARAETQVEYLAKLPIDQSRLKEAVEFKISFFPRTEFFSRGEEGAGPFVRTGGENMAKKITATIPFLNLKNYVINDPNAQATVPSTLSFVEIDGQNGEKTPQLQDQITFTDKIKPQMPMVSSADGTSYSFTPQALTTMIAAEKAVIHGGELENYIVMAGAHLTLQMMKENKTPYTLDASDVIVTDSRQTGALDSVMGSLSEKDQSWRLKYLPYTITISVMPKPMAQK